MVPFLVKLFLVQAVAITLVVLVLRQILANILTENALHDFENWKAKDHPGSVGPVTVTSTRDLNAARKERVFKATTKLTGGSFKPEFRIDKTIWGGMVITIGDHRLEHTVRDRIRQAFGKR